MLISGGCRRRILTDSIALLPLKDSVAIIIVPQLVSHPTIFTEKAVVDLRGGS